MSIYVELLKLYDQTLDQARKLTADLPAEKWTYQPAPQTNHATWVIGHLAHTSDYMAYLLGDTLRSPESWNNLFGYHSEPVSDASVYPTPKEVWAAFEDAHKHLTERVKQAPDSIWDKTPIDPSLVQYFPTNGGFALLVLGSHESFHLGQLSAWRRVQGLPRV